MNDVLDEAAVGLASMCMGIVRRRLVRVAGLRRHNGAFDGDGCALERNRGRRKHVISSQKVRQMPFEGIDEQADAWPEVLGCASRAVS